VRHVAGSHRLFRDSQWIESKAFRNIALRHGGIIHGGKDLPKPVRAERARHQALGVERSTDHQEMTNVCTRSFRVGKWTWDRSFGHRYAMCLSVANLSARSNIDLLAARNFHTLSSLATTRVLRKSQRVPCCKVTSQSYCQADIRSWSS
jgi:hypothetical protein